MIFLFNLLYKAFIFLPVISILQTERSTYNQCRESIRFEYCISRFSDDAMQNKWSICEKIKVHTHKSVLHHAIYSVNVTFQVT